MGEDDKPNKHDGDRDGQGIYQPDKTETPKDYGRGSTRRTTRARTTRKSWCTPTRIGRS